MDTVKATATITAYAAAGAVIGNLIDAISEKIFDSWDVRQPAVRVGLQLTTSIAALGNIISSLAGNVGVIDDTYGAIPAMWFFFFRSQRNLLSDIDALVNQLTGAAQTVLQPKAAPEAMIDSGLASNADQEARAARVRRNINAASE